MQIIFRRMNRIKIFKSNTLRFLEQDVNNFIADKVVKNISMQVSQNDYIVIILYEEREWKSIL